MRFSTTSGIQESLTLSILAEKIEAEVADETKQEVKPAKTSRRGKSKTVKEETAAPVVEQPGDISIFHCEMSEDILFPSHYLTSFVFITIVIHSLVLVFRCSGSLRKAETKSEENIGCSSRKL